MVNLELISTRASVAPYFSFRIVTTKGIKAIIRDLSTNKAAGGEIPVNILKKSNFFFAELTIFFYIRLNAHVQFEQLKNTYNKKNERIIKRYYRPYICIYIRILLRDC